MANTPDTYHFGEVVQVQHVDCRVPFDYEYNGVFGRPSQQQEYVLQQYDFNTISAEDLVSLLSRPGISKSSITQWYMEHYGYNVFTGLWDKLYPSINKRYLYDSHFYTMYGKGNWLVYGDSGNNLERALTRITKVRDNEVVLSNNQSTLGNLNTISRFMRNGFRGRGRNRLLYSVLGKIKTRVQQRLTLLSDEFVERFDHAHKEHQKKRLRIESLNKLLETAECGLYVQEIKGKLKLYEKAKPGKNPRLIGDYTCPGSLLGGFLAEYAKECFEEEISLLGFKTKYISSIEPEVLDRLGSDLLRDPINQFYFFSDDSVLKYDGRYYEIDISSCDISNSTAIFEILVGLFAGTQFECVVRRCVQQCQLAAKLTSPENRHNKIRLQGIRAIEYSGSVLTTLLNNIASLLIGLSIHFDGASDIAASANAIGYNVTQIERNSLEELTFLKHSWFYDGDSDPRSFLNVGAILRSFGTFTGDLPGPSKRNIVLRCEDFLSTVVSGYRHAGESSVLKALQKRFPFRNSTGYYDKFIENKHFSFGKRGLIPDLALIRRYGVSQSDIDHFCDLITNGKMFTHFSCRFIDAVYSVDYGLR